MIESNKLSGAEVKKLPNLRVNLDQLLAVSVPVSGLLAFGAAVGGNVEAALALGAYSVLIGRHIFKQWS